MEGGLVRIYFPNKRQVIAQAVVFLVFAILSSLLMPSFLIRLGSAIFFLGLIGLFILAGIKGRVELYEDRICYRPLFSGQKICLVLSEIGGIFEDHFLMWEFESSHFYYLIPRALLKEERKLHRVIPASFKRRSVCLSTWILNYKDLLSEIVKRLPRDAYIDPFVSWVNQLPHRKWSRQEIIDFYRQAEPGRLFH